MKIFFNLKEKKQDFFAVGLSLDSVSLFNPDRPGIFHVEQNDLKLLPILLSLISAKNRFHYSYNHEQCL